MRTPRISGNGVFSGGGVAADAAFELEKQSVRHASAIQPAQGSETSHAPANDNGIDLQRLRRRRETVVPQPMPKGGSRADNSTGKVARLFLVTGRRECACCGSSAETEEMTAIHR